jgi:hypothetical protein
MSEKDKRYIDPEMEKFLKENREMLEKLFREEKEMLKSFYREEKEFFKGAFDEECSKAEEFSEEQKKKAKDAAQGMFNAFTDPEVQKHFLSMGIEFMMAMTALMKAMPIPDAVKDMADKADEARKKAYRDTHRRSKDPESTGPEKINIDSAPKKKAPAGKKEKTSD